MATSVNRCFQNPDFNIVHPFLHFDTVIKQNEKQRRHILVDYYPAKSACSCPCLTQMPSSEGEVRSREKNMGVVSRQWKDGLRILNESNKLKISLTISELKASRYRCSTHSTEVHPLYSVFKETFLELDPFSKEILWRVTIYTK